MLAVVLAGWVVALGLFVWFTSRIARGVIR